MSITKYLNLSHLRKLLSALGQRFYAIEQRQDNLQSQIENIDLDVETDTTLSVSGMPADAGVVGATFNDLNATAWSGNISSLDNITNLDQDALYSGAGYFTLNGSAISALYIPTKATASRFFVFVPEDNVLFSEGTYCYIYSKKQPTTSIGRFNYLFVNGSRATTLNHGLYLGTVNSYSPNNTTLSLAILFTYDQAASSLGEKPLANGDEASYGSSIKYARADHIHPHDTLKANVSAVLTKTNTTAYTPTATYHPATKGYVDELIPTKVSDLNNDSGFQTQTQVENAIAQSAEVVVVNLTSTTADDVTTYTADKTYAELYAAYAAGKTLILFKRMSSKAGSYFHLLSCSPAAIIFCQVDAIFAYHCFKIKNDNTIVKENYTNVRTINGKYNDVTLTYSDVGALPDSTVIPTKVSDLNNDAGYQTQAQVNALIAAAGDDDTTYAISISGNVITLTGSDGNTSTVTLPVYTGGVV